MLFVTKKIAAFTLIIAMTLTNAGVSTFATSVQYLTSSVESDAENLNKKDYRIYEEFKYEERSSVLLNGGGRLFGENNNLNDTGSPNENPVEKNISQDSVSDGAINTTTGNDTKTTDGSSSFDGKNDENINDDSAIDTNKFYQGSIDLDSPEFIGPRYDKEKLSTNSNADEELDNDQDIENTNDNSYEEEPEESILIQSDIEEAEEHIANVEELEEDKDENISIQSDIEETEENIENVEEAEDDEVIISSLSNLSNGVVNIEEGLFGAPPDYDFPRDWAETFVNAGYAKNRIKTITFEKSSTSAPATSLFNATIPDSNGLELYVSENSVVGAITYYDVTVYAPTNDTIYAPVDASRLFDSFTRLESINNLAYLDTSNVTNMSYMFRGCYNLTPLDVTSFNTSNVTNMNNMFNGCSSLTTIDLSSFNTSNVRTMNGMFFGCTSFTTLDVSSFDTSNVTDIGNMFGECSSLTTLDITHFNTSNVTNMYGIFHICSSLTTLDVRSFNTSSVTNMREMFHDCSSLTTLDVTHFDTSNVTNMMFMFRGCSSLTTLDLSSFDTSNVTDMAEMFNGDTNLAIIIASTSFITTSVTSDTDMFINCTALTGGSGTTYVNKYALDPTTAVDRTFARIDGLGGLDGYFTGLGPVPGPGPAPTPATNYVLSATWAETIVNAGYAKDMIRKITFKKSPAATPATSLFNATIPDSNGLELYVTQNTTLGYANRDITIYAQLMVLYI